MSAIVKRIARAKVSEGTPFAETTLTDAISGVPIESVRGNGTKFQFAFFDPDDAIADISGFSSVTHQIRKSQMEGSTVLATKTVAAVDFGSPTSSTWLDRTAQHVEFDYSDAEMNFDPGGPLRRYWMTIKATLIAGGTNVLSAGWYVHQESNSEAGSPTENPGTQISQEEADARFVRYDGDQTLSADNVNQALENLDLFDAGDTIVNGAKFTRNPDGGLDLELYDQGTDAFRKVRLDDGTLIVE